ncbi:helix-turn-helix transcriptional regulator [Oculatella sp. FACHB-28]|uniref:helix-turn-helix domain-containing protein n=1 Tax=Oculatella sp. FACHB-28 TaxID=2692845 RepID=UPI001682C789|nr:helix-turn-helix transcriptional regulator [Oculatella sp. FACHB-28]MBD2058109.1 helix-turn-helix transcriptional regulator [Oculatella sp. FACHB-28]
MGASTHSDEYQEFLKRLRAARLESGLTQLEVANRLGEPQSYVSKCESGERRVDIVELSKFAEIYERPVSYFLGKEN